MTVTLAFWFAIGGAGAMALDDMNDAASNVMVWMTQHEEDNEKDMVVFLQPPFFWDVFALCFFGCADGWSAAVDGVIAYNIPLQLL